MLGFGHLWPKPDTLAGCSSSWSVSQLSSGWRANRKLRTIGVTSNCAQKPIIGLINVWRISPTGYRAAKVVAWCAGTPAQKRQRSELLAEDATGSPRLPNH